MVRISVFARGRFGAAHVLLAVFAVAAVMAVLGFEATPAVAQGYAPWFFHYGSPRTEPPRYWKRRPQSRPRAARNNDGHQVSKKARAPAAREAKAAEPAKPKRPLFAVISIADQHVSIYNHDGLVVRSRISTGMAGHPTPKGIFTIIGRERYHKSNIYSGAPMPFMQRITWSGIAMHLGVVPGYPASHGCIRLPAGFAAQLWGMTRIGERIVISRQEAAPVEFAHPLLPAPKMRAQTAANDTAPASGSILASAVVSQPALLNPIQYAEQLKVKAAAEAAAAVKAIKETLTAASARQMEAALAAVDLKKAEAAHALAQAKADAAAKAYEAAAPDAKDAAVTTKTNAAAALAATAAKLETAKKASAAKASEWADAVRRSNEARAASEAAANSMKEASRRMSPVSVLVSKKDQRIYVRQGLAPIFDAPASVRDPETPLGSHLYIATALSDDGASLEWSVVSMPAQAAEQQSGRLKKKASGEETAGTPPMLTRRPASSPAEALERVEFARDVRDRIAELLWTGGSLIVSDQPLSNETGNVGTDLVVKAR